MLLESNTVIEQRKRLAALSVGAVAILVIFPLWWKTTEVYRAPLPYNEIEELSNQHDVFTVTREITVVALFENEATEQTNLLITKIEKYLAITNQAAAKTKERHITLNYNIKTADSAVVNAVREKLKSHDEIKEVSDVMATSCLLMPMGHLSLVIFDHSVNPKLFAVIEHRAFISKHRIALLQFPQEEMMNVEQMFPVVVNALEAVYGGTDLQKVLSESLRIHSQETVDADRMRQLRPSAGVQLSFTLLNSDPSSLHTQWNIERAVDGLLKPFLNHQGISSLGSFLIESQLLYYADLKLNPAKRDGLYKVSADNLPQALSVLESRLGFQVSQLPILSFVIYTPPIDKSPLYLYRPPDWSHGFTSFLSPQWGGLMVYNHNLTINDDAHLLVDVNHVMPTFITQLKKLLGLPEIVGNLDSVQLEELASHELYDWQVDRLLEAKMVECVSFTLTTLQSLLQLLDEVKNMVISDDIQQEVEYSLKALMESKQYSKDGRLDVAFQSAKESMHSAEKAFFDPSILALLYFPDDQK